MRPSRSFIASTPVVVAALLSPAAAHAAGGEGTTVTTLVWHAINFALLVGIIVYFARSPLQAHLASRRENIEASIDGARRELDAAERRLSEWQGKVESLDSEMEELRRTVREQAESEAAQLLKDAREGAERIGRDAAAAVDQEVRVARERLRAEAAALSVQLAGELLEQRVTDEDRQRLLDDFVDRVERAATIGSEASG